MTDIKTDKRGRLGYEKCPIWLKNSYRLQVDYKCQECREVESIVGRLEAHRMQRGNAGGLYTIMPIKEGGNVKMCCKKCHKKLHQGEPGCRNK